LLPINPLTPTVAIWVLSILCQTGLSSQPVICNFWYPGTVTLSPEQQSALTSKITNDGLTRSGTGYLYPYGNSGCQRVKLFGLISF